MILTELDAILTYHFRNFFRLLGSFRFVGAAARFGLCDGGVKARLRLAAGVG